MFQLVGVNGVGFEATNGLVTDGRTLPWLQDVAEKNVWSAWDVEYRDVIILDAQGVQRAVFNLTSHDLAVPANHDTLKQLLLDAR